MALRIVSCTSVPSRTERVPDELRVGVGVVAALEQQGVLSEVERWLPLARRGGHGSRSLFAFCVVFLLAGRSWGLRPFQLRFARALQRAVAPVVGLRSLVSASALSRALGRLGHGEVRSFGDSVLPSAKGLADLLAHPAAQHRDAHGRGWHVLDLDPTVEAFRQRGLPEGDELPAGERRAPGRAGYTGHKRGELRIRHLPVQHAGAGIWLGYRLDATGGSLFPLVGEVVRNARQALPGPPAELRAVVRMDGEFGSVGAMRTTIAEHVDVLTRLSRYSLLRRPVITERLATGTWQAVPASGGGPARQAIELGIFELFPDHDAADAAAGPVEVRVVASRFPRRGEPEHGVVIDGQQVELFATTLTADAWPAGDLVALYFGRSALENRFAQEDREFGMDRTFSFHPPGQEWVSVVALFLWNVLVLRGVAADPLPQVPVPAKDGAPILQNLPPGSPPDAGEPAMTEAVSVAHASPPALPTSTTQADPVERRLRSELWGIACAAFTAHPLPTGWSVDEVEERVVCPNGDRLFVYAVESEVRRKGGRERTKHRIMLRTDMRACNGCPHRDGCTSSDRPDAYKQVTRTIPPEAAVRGREILALLRPHAHADAVRRRRAHTARAMPDTKPPPARPERAEWPGRPPGPFTPTSPLFLPAQSRHRARTALRDLLLEVLATVPTRRAPRSHPLLARDVADRQHRRQDHARRAERWRLHRTTTLLVAGRPGAILGVPKNRRCPA